MPISLSLSLSLSQSAALTKTAVSVMHEHLGAQRARRKVVDTASTIGHIAQYHNLCAGEARDDVAERAGKDGEALGQLQGDDTRAEVEDLRDGLGQLEGVGGGQQRRDCGVERVDIVRRSGGGSHAAARGRGGEKASVDDEDADKEISRVAHGAKSRFPRPAHSWRQTTAPELNSV
jgi:hypothetical protein